MKNKGILLILAMMLLISGCGLSSEPPHPEQEKSVSDFFKKTYNTDLVGVRVKAYKEPYKDPKLDKMMQYVGVAFTKQDPSLGVQFYIDDSGTVIDLVNKKQYEIRVKIGEILKKYRPSNSIGDYFGFEPGGISGPMLRSFNLYDGHLTFGVLSDKINVKEELQTDHLIAAEIQKLYYEYFPERKSDNDKSFQMRVIYYEKNGFDLAKWMQEGKWAKFFHGEIDQGRIADYLDVEDRTERTFFKTNAKPYRILDYWFDDRNEDKTIKNISSLTSDQFFEEVKKKKNCRCR